MFIKLLRSHLEGSRAYEDGIIKTKAFALTERSSRFWLLRFFR